LRVIERDYTLPEYQLSLIGRKASPLPYQHVCGTDKDLSSVLELNIHTYPITITTGPIRALSQTETEPVRISLQDWLSISPQ
jgi:hypothetical protein